MFKKYDQKYWDKVSKLAGVSSVNIGVEKAKDDNKDRNIISENEIKLISHGGRSDERTISWHCEEYILNLGSEFLTQLDDLIHREFQEYVLNVHKGDTKISSNTLIIKISIEKKEDQKERKDFTITMTVNFDDSSNTVATINHQNITNKANLSSKHSSSDIDKFLEELTTNVLNSVEMSEKSEKENAKQPQIN